MKKRKPPARASTDFKHTPFASLKNVAPKQASGGPKTAPLPARREKSGPEHDDEAALFLRAVEGARKLPSAREDSAAPDVPRPTRGKNDAGPEAELFLQAMQKIGAVLRDEPAERESGEQGRRSPTSRLRQLKRGTIRIARELDLHGLVKDEAVHRLGRFVEDAYLRGERAVLVITGKGMNSPDGPVLRGAAAGWLRNEGKGMVAEFSPAPRGLGGSGAFVVFLRKNETERGA
jgi:DNA-nicking Smr family endonuclease